MTQFCENVHVLLSNLKENEFPLKAGACSIRTLYYFAGIFLSISFEKKKYGLINLKVKHNKSIKMFTTSDLLLLYQLQILFVFNS